MTIVLTRQGLAAAIIRSGRILLGVTQEELGSMLRVSGSTVSRWELGQQIPADAVLHRLGVLVSQSKIGGLQ